MSAALACFGCVIELHVRAHLRWWDPSCLCTRWLPHLHAEKKRRRAQNRTAAGAAVTNGQPTMDGRFALPCSFSARLALVCIGSLSSNSRMAAVRKGQESTPKNVPSYAAAYITSLQPGCDPDKEQKHSILLNSLHTWVLLLRHYTRVETKTRAKRNSDTSTGQPLPAKRTHKRSTRRVYAHVSVLSFATNGTKADRAFRALLSDS